MKKHHSEIYKDQPEKHIAKKFFKFRLADEEDAYALSGYRYNAITPFFMNNNSLKIVLPDSLVSGLNPAYFWLGGGRVELKMGVSVEEF
jgi:prolyl-tRNA editing enzyme YbaK/EbsC (Cys-tRNA(Pro) deacylase)